ncbi:MAG: hypothetical protein ACK5LC_02710 [Coprobacillaceae bacterium]
MIIGKIMMVQNSSPVDSVDYLISKKVMLLKSNIKNYTLERFIEELGVSRTSMVRYMKNIGIQRFSRFKAVMYDECMKAYVDFKRMKEDIKDKQFSAESKELAKHLMQSKKVVLLGDGNRYSLILFQKAFTYLGIDTEIPVYLGSEEEVINNHKLTKDDLAILISLHESYESFLENRASFYLDGNFLEIETKANIGFIGLEGTYHNEHLLFEYKIEQNTFDRIIKDIVKLMQEAMLVILQQSNLDILF